MKLPHKRIGEVRCLNCFKRFRPPVKVEKTVCPYCKMEWRLSWLGGMAKIRGPVWGKIENKNGR